MGVVLGVVVALVVVFLVWSVAAVVAAFRTADPDLVERRGGVELRPRTFSGDPSGVQHAYEAALPQVPGVSVLRSEPGRMWADSKPTPRLLGGVYGLVVRFDFDAQAAVDGSSVTRVVTRAAPKLSWAPSVKSITLQPAAAEVERRTRMAAKKLGARELK